LCVLLFPFRLFPRPPPLTRPCPVEVVHPPLVAVVFSSPLFYLTRMLWFDWRSEGMGPHPSVPPLLLYLFSIYHQTIQPHLEPLLTSFFPLTVANIQLLSPDAQVPVRTLFSLTASRLCGHLLVEVPGRLVNTLLCVVSFSSSPASSVRPKLQKWEDSSSLFFCPFPRN